MSEVYEQGIDFRTLGRGIRRNLPLILSATVLMSAGVYFWSRSQPPVYTATASLISSNSASTNNNIVEGGIVRASSLPQGTIPLALQSPRVIQEIISNVQKSTVFSRAEKSEISQRLNKELRSQDLRLITLSVSQDFSSAGSGIFKITATGAQPQSAADLANYAANALLNWDKSRAQSNFIKASEGFQAQLQQIDRQLQMPDAITEIERQTLMARRLAILGNLTTIQSLKNSVEGVLSPLAEALPPLEAKSPKPLRDAILIGLLTLLLGSGLAALVSLLDRTIRNEEDLLRLDVPTLATVPRLRRRDVILQGIVRAARQAGLYEALGFLRVNLFATLQNVEHPIIMISSTVPGEGKSSVTATLADSLATGGQRVLLIDADLRRGTQAEVWQKFNESEHWCQLVGEGGARTTYEALQNPHNVQVIEVEENLHILPAGLSIQDSSNLLNRSDLSEIFRSWSKKYDVVLIDSAPLLALADGLLIGQSADALVLVVEAGRTNVQEIRKTMRRIDKSGLKFIGAVINKQDIKNEGSYGYGYTKYAEVS